jgi:phage/plasmid primase-like uncharacterized protein
MASAADIACRLGGRGQGDSGRAPCPLQCGYTLSLRDAEGGRLLAYCFGGCEFADIMAALVEFGAFDYLGGDMYAPPPGKPPASKASRIKDALKLYESFGPAVGTLIETYVHAVRCISIPLPPILRYGQYRHLGCNRPTMAVPVTDIDGRQTATHLTFLRSDGRKADLPKDDQRRTLGIIGGCSIRLAPHNGRDLLIGEGVESTLSAMQIFGLPGWAAINAANLQAVNLPSSVRNVIVAADHDVSGAGFRNAQAAAERWRFEGRSVRLAMPPIAGDDFNDVLVKRGWHG